MLRQHLISSCPHTNFKCKKCSSVVKRLMIPAHKKDCEELFLKAEVEYQKNELESQKEFYENKISRQRLKM